MPLPDLHSRNSARPQQVGDLRRQRAIGVQSILTPIQSHVRIEPRNLGHEGVYLAPGNIRRISYHYMHIFAKHCLSPITNDEQRPIGEAEAPCVIAGAGRGIVPNVNADADRRRQFAQEGEQETATAGAKIQNGIPSVPIHDVAQDRLHHGFGVRPGVEDRGVDVQIEAPELPPAKNAADRFPLQASPYQGVNRGKLRCGGRAVALSQQAGPIERQGGADEMARIGGGGLDAGLP